MRVLLRRHGTSDMWRHGDAPHNYPLFCTATTPSGTGRQPAGQSPRTYWGLGTAVLLAPQRNLGQTGIGTDRSSPVRVRAPVAGSMWNAVRELLSWLAQTR